MRLVATFLLILLEVRCSKIDCPSGCSCASNLIDCGSLGNLPLFNLPSRIPKNATHLDMNGNSVTKLDNVCRNYDRLGELRLNSNGLKEIKHEAFEDCNELITLTISNNELMKIKRDTVSSFSSFIFTLSTIFSLLALTKFKFWS